MAKKRNGRQDAIRDIVRNKDVRTQRVLVDELRAMGFDCTQATVSRDIADMGLRKLPEASTSLPRTCICSAWFPSWLPAYCAPIIWL